MGLQKWSRLDCFGSLGRSGRGWSEDDVSRLLRRLVLDEILGEDVIANPQGGSFAYLCESSLTDRALNGHIRLVLDRGVTGAALEAGATPRASPGSKAQQPKSAK